MRLEDCLPHRKSPRLKEYDYRTPNYYFVTICTYEKKCIFGEPEKMNDIGKIAKDGFQMIEDAFSGVTVDISIVMPNHVHAIIVLTDDSHNLSAIVGSYKSYVTRKIHAQYPNQKVWQISFHEHIIRDRKGYEKIWEYIAYNSLKWKDDCFYTE